MSGKPINCELTLKNGEYASIIADDLDNDTIKAITEDKKQLIGVFSPPNTGKTTLINIKAKRNTDVGLYTVVVGPTILLNDKINDGLNGAVNFNGEKYDDITNTIVVSTPEGLNNVVSMLEKNKAYFELHVDEIHERIDSAETRVAYKDVDKVIYSKYCVSAFLYTGTPDVVEGYYDFTKIYRINKEGKKITNHPKIINVDKMTNESIKDCIEYAYINYRAKDGQIFAFINDKEKHSYINQNIDLDIFKSDSINKSEILFISSKTKNDRIVKEIIKTKKVPNEYKMIIVTSSASAGVEFELENPATVMVVCSNYTFNIRQEIQSTIRVRTDIEELMFIKPRQQTEKESYLSYDKFFKNRYQKYLNKLEQRINFWEELKLVYNKNTASKRTKKILINSVNFREVEEDLEDEAYFKALIYNEDLDTFEIDKALLHKYISDEYSAMILLNTNDFIKAMNHGCTHFDFEGHEFEKLSYNDLFKRDEILEAIEEVLSVNNDSTKESKKQEQEVIKREYVKKIREYDISDKDKISVIVKDEDNPISKALHKDLYNTVEVLESIDGAYKSLKTLLDITIKEEDQAFYLNEYLNNATATKLNKYKIEEKIKTEMPVVYKLVNENNIETIKKQPNAIQEKCLTLLYYRKDNGSYRGITINEESKKGLLSHLQKYGLWKKKVFTDDIDKKLFNLLDTLFVLYEVPSSSKGKSKKHLKTHRVSSLRY